MKDTMKKLKLLFFVGILSMTLLGTISVEADDTQIVTSSQATADTLSKLPPNAPFWQTNSDIYPATIEQIAFDPNNSQSLAVLVSGKQQDYIYVCQNGNWGNIPFAGSDKLGNGERVNDFKVSRDITGNISWIEIFFNDNTSALLDRNGGLIAKELDMPSGVTSNLIFSDNSSSIKIMGSDGKVYTYDDSTTSLSTPMDSNLGANVSAVWYDVNGNVWYARGDQIFDNSDNNSWTIPQPPSRDNTISAIYPVSNTNEAQFIVGTNTGYLYILYTTKGHPWSMDPDWSFGSHSEVPYDDSSAIENIIPGNDPSHYYICLKKWGIYYANSNDMINPFHNNLGLIPYEISAYGEADIYSPVYNLLFNGTSAPSHMFFVGNGKYIVTNIQSTPLLAGSGQNENWIVRVNIQDDKIIGNPIGVAKQPFNAPLKDCAIFNSNGSYKLIASSYDNPNNLFIIDLHLNAIKWTINLTNNTSFTLQVHPVKTASCMISSAWFNDFGTNVVNSGQTCSISGTSDTLQSNPFEMIYANAYVAPLSDNATETEKNDYINACTLASKYYGEFLIGVGNVSDAVNKSNTLAGGSYFKDNGNDVLLPASGYPLFITQSLGQYLSVDLSSLMRIHGSGTSSVKPFAVTASSSNIDSNNNVTINATISNQ